MAAPEFRSGRLVLRRGRLSARARWARLRVRSWQVGQCAIAAGVAWFIASDLLGHPTPFFAPIAAVVSLGVSYEQRLRRVAEVTVGVALGVFVGDVFAQLVGTGAWQLMVIVALAMGTALLLDGSPLFITQAAVQAIVVTTLVPEPDAAFVRWTDALIGGAVALVAATVVPRAPLRRPREQASRVVARIATVLRSSADAIEDGDVDRALEVLADARSTDVLIRDLQAAADEGASVVASSPFRLRHRHGVRRMSDLVEPLDLALRNTRVLARRVAVAAYRDEPMPLSYAPMLRQLADAAETLSVELADDLATSARTELLEAAQRTSRIERGLTLSGDVVLGQARSIVADLLAVSGMDPFDATDAIPRRSRVVVGAAIVRDGAVLAARRSSPPELAGQWEFPGGKTERGESAEEALRREIREELGCTVEVEAWLATEVEIRRGLVLWVARCRLVEGEPEPREHDDLRWVPLDELDDLPWLEPDRPFLPLLR